VDEYCFTVLFYTALHCCATLWVRCICVCLSVCLWVPATARTRLVTQFGCTAAVRGRVRLQIFLPRDAMQAQPMSSCGVCPYVCVCVCLCVTFVDSVKKNKHIFKPSGSQAILDFPYQTACQYSDRNPRPLMGASNAGGVGRNRDSDIWLHCVLSTLRPARCYHQYGAVRPRSRKV